MAGPMRGWRYMLKWTFNGCRLVSSNDEGFFKKVTPTWCGPASTRRANLQMPVDRCVGRFAVIVAGFATAAGRSTVNDLTGSESSSNSN